MNLVEQIRQELAKHLSPIHLEVIDESSMHSRGENSHFRVLVVSKQFDGLSRVERQQRVAEILKKFLDSGVHALGQRTLTPEEWSKTQGQTPLSSPDCAHKSKSSI